MLRPMLATVRCPNCDHIGAFNTAQLPRSLVCSQCGTRAVLKASTPLRSPTVMREQADAERAAGRRLALVAPAKISPT
jgi:DNA-directed RNA polymerase subunit RPC12/RpoP